MNLLPAFLILCVAQSLAWFQIFSASVPGLSRFHWLGVVLTIGTAAGICFRWGTDIVMDVNGEAWTARILAFAAGNLMFALLTWYFLNQGIDKRTAVALVLCVAAVVVKVA